MDLESQWYTRCIWKYSGLLKDILEMKYIWPTAVIIYKTDAIKKSTDMYLHKLVVAALCVCLFTNEKANRKWLW